MSKHTPGPWKRDAENDCPRDIFSPDNELLATAYPMGDEQRNYNEFELVTAIANAKLIAAAPMLLDAAKYYLDSESTTTECDHRFKAAIAQAEGDD